MEINSQVIIINNFSRSHNVFRVVGMWEKDKRLHKLSNGSCIYLGEIVQNKFIILDIILTRLIFGLIKFMSYMSLFPPYYQLNSNGLFSHIFHLSYVFPKTDHTRAQESSTNVFLPTSEGTFTVGQWNVTVRCSKKACWVKNNPCDTESKRELPVW